MRFGTLTVGSLVFVISALTTGGPVLAAPPPNDDIANAMVIGALPFSHTAGTGEATVEAGEATTCSGLIFSRTVWYKYTPAAAVRVVVSSFGGGFTNPTQIAVYTQDPLSGFPAAYCDAPSQPSSCISVAENYANLVLDLAAGQAYYFQLTNFVYDITRLHLIVALPPPANDDCDQASVIEMSPFSQAAYTYSATVAADDPNICGFPAQNATVWYAFTPLADTVAEVSAFGLYPIGITVLTGTCGALTTVGCGNCGVTPVLTGGQTYYFMVQAAEPVLFNAGSFMTISLRGGPPPRPAVKVFGQPDPFTAVANNGGRSASSLSGPTGVAVDASGDRLYVADRGGLTPATANNRILEYQDPVTGDTVADLVIGQPDDENDFDSGTANWEGISRRTLNRPTEVALDPEGKLYVADLINNRVLRYHSPLTTGAMADLVLGQPDEFTGTQNTGGRSEFTLALPSGVAVGADGSLYVGEFSNSRAVRYNAPLFSFDAADLVLGEPNFTTPFTPGTSAKSLGATTDVMLDQTGNLFVSDITTGRVLKFSPPRTMNEPSADLVIGQPDFTTLRDPGCFSGFGVSASTLCDPRGLAIDCAGNLYVADLANNRVLIYKDPLTTDTVADEVLGQYNFTTITSNWQGVSARTFSQPRGVAVDEAGTLFVADAANHRVLMFEAFNGGDLDFDDLDGPQDACPCEAPSMSLDADQNGCTDSLAGLRTIVEGLTIASQVKNGLLGKLDEAQKALDRNNTRVAINKLQAFIDQVEGQRGQGISESDADLLVAYANNLIAIINASA